VIVQDNGPGIVKAQVPKIFGKLLYGSKFHRYKQARGQQGIGISAAAMYGQLTTGKPIRVTSRVGKGKATHVFDIQLDTRKNEPVVTHDETLGQWHQDHGTRVELEIVANWQQGQRFVNRYVEHTALANPHATIHYTRPVGAAQRAGTDQPGNETLTFPRATTELPKEALEIKPHPHGVELGALMLMARESKSRDVRGFLQTAFSRVSSSASGDILAKVPWGKKAVKPRILGENRQMAEELHKAIAASKLMSPPTNCLSPIGDELMKKGLVSFLSVIESEGESIDQTIRQGFGGHKRALIDDGADFVGVEAAFEGIDQPCDAVVDLGGLVDEPSTNRVNFHAFVGVAPRRYMDFFESFGTRKTEDGRIKTVDEISAVPRLRRLVLTYTLGEAFVVKDIAPQLSQAKARRIE